MGVAVVSAGHSMAQAAVGKEERKDRWSSGVDHMAARFVRTAGQVGHNLAAVHKVVVRNSVVHMAAAHKVVAHKVVVRMVVVHKVVVHKVREYPRRPSGKG